MKEFNKTENLKGKKNSVIKCTTQKRKDSILPVFKDTSVKAVKVLKPVVSNKIKNLVISKLVKNSKIDK